MFSHIWEHYVFYYGYFLSRSSEPRTYFCRAFQYCSICKIVKIELEPLLAVRNTNEQLI